MKQREVTRNSEHEFSGDRSYLSEQIHFGENLARFEDKGRAADTISLGFNKSVGTPSHSVIQVGRLWWEGCGMVVVWWATRGVKLWLDDGAWRLCLVGSTLPGIGSKGRIAGVCHIRRSCSFNRNR